MQVHEAQQEVRQVFIGGAVGQAVSGLIWLISAALATWAGQRPAILMLAVGGAFIFPLTQLTLKLLGQRATLRKDNPFNALATQIAFTVPLNLPVILGAMLYKTSWFYPAFMIVVGAHYLPFVSLYGMRAYAVLAAVLIGGGVVFGMYFPDLFSLGGWFTAMVLLLFAGIIWTTQRSPKHLNNL